MKTLPRIASRLSGWLGALAGAGFASTVPVAAQNVPPSAAPVEWVRYAETATSAISDWLRTSDEPAVRLRTYLERTREAEDRPTPAIEIRVWIAADGIVSRIEFPPFAHAEANNDLRALIVGKRLPGPPPQDMRQPIRIAVALDVRPATPGDGGASIGPIANRT